MWIMTLEGPVSIVKDKESPTLLWCRGRQKETLLRLFEDDKVEIIATPNRDYPYRVSITPHRLAAIVARWVSEIDYTNFKDAVSVHRDRRTHDIYTSVYNNLSELDERNRL